MSCETLVISSVFIRSLFVCFATARFMPVAMLSVIFSERYKGDVSFASTGVMMTTLMCIITIPLHAILLQHV